MVEVRYLYLIMAGFVLTNFQLASPDPVKQCVKIQPGVDTSTRRTAKKRDFSEDSNNCGDFRSTSIVLGKLFTFQYLTFSVYGMRLTRALGDS